jgi:hypothetical protein
MAVPIMAKLRIIGGSSSHPVGIGPDDERAYRPGDESGPERRQRQHQASELAVRGEECAADLDSEITVGDEIVEFEHIADGGAESGTAGERRRISFKSDRLREFLAPASSQSVDKAIAFLHNCACGRGNLEA